MSNASELGIVDEPHEMERKKFFSCRRKPLNGKTR
jgi:hypothetical protein